MKKLLVLIALLSFCVTADDSSDLWVESTLKGMTVGEKVGQLLFDRIDGRFVNQQDPRFLLTKERIRKLGLGGVVVFLGTPHDTAAQLNALQRDAKVPLLVGGDLERGAAMRITGALAVPHNMALAATGDPSTAAFAAELTAREGLAIGIQWNYSPVADVNNNADNPIINIRSFGEDPQLVSRMVAAYTRAAESAGILSTAKHFPGHGDTATDSHMALGVVEGDRQRLERVELAPFRAAIEAGASSIMTAHLAVPAIEPDRALPATMSRNILTGLLREQMGFKGIIATDALEMAGVTANYWPGEIALRAFEAGADVLLLSTHPEIAHRVMVEAVRSGRISEQRLNQSVERILRAKARVNLHRHRLVDLNKVSEIVADPTVQQRIEQVASRTITLVRDTPNALPVAMSGRKKVMALVVSADAGNAGDTFISEIRKRAEDADVVRMGPDFTQERADAALQRAAGADVILAGLFIRVADGKGTVGMPAVQVALLKKLAALGKPLLAISFGSPYVIGAFPEVQTYLCAYSISDVSERAGVRALFGETAITGHLPVQIPGVAPLGTGLKRAALDFALHDVTGVQDQRFAPVFRLLDNFAAEHAFPGAVVAVGHKGQLAALKSFGRFDYSNKSPAVPTDAIFDMASVTKVMSTTTAAAILYERKTLLLDIPVVRYIPEFGAARGHDKITVRQLLTHSSGLPSYEKLFLLPEVKTRADVLQRIYTMPLAAQPGEKYAYSDFGMILMAEVIERAGGMPIEDFMRKEVWEPLGMTNTMYRPDRALLERIMPTEQDDTFRHRLVRGEVHDENAWVMGGVSGHAGLFSTALDVAKFMQMWLNGGTYDGKRILKRGTVNAFITRQPGPPGSTRALGWDTPGPKNSSAGTLLSPLSFGHTGFTGTSVWADPEKELFVVLLTNRVYPSRQNAMIAKVRPAVHDAVVEALR